MPTWRDLSAAGRTAATELFTARRWRDCVSRAYYAVYSETAYALLQAGVAMPAGREGPHHLPLPQIIGNNLMTLPMARRWRLSGLVSHSYNLRVLADYRPSVIVDEPEARISIGLMTQAFRILEVMP